MNQAGIDRRSLIAKVGVGAGIAWVAPTILSVSAAAAATCLPVSVDWTGFEGSLNVLQTTPFDVPIGGTETINLSFSDANMAPGVGTVSYASTVPLGGRGGGFIEMSIDATPGPPTQQYIELTFTFSAAVTNLQFSLIDIDLGAGFWQDQVTLFASRLGAPVLLGPGDFVPSVPANITHTAVAGGDQFNGAIDPPDGQPGVDNTTTGGDIAITYTAPIDLLVIRYEPGSLTDRETQQIGIDGFTLCV